MFVPAMFRSTHWSNIHHTLLNALPDKSIIHFHHTVTDFDQPEGSNKVKVTAEVGEDKKAKAFEGDFLVACDGSMSSVRAKFRPHDKRRCLLLHLTLVHLMLLHLILVHLMFLHLMLFNLMMLANSSSGQL